MARRKKLFWTPCAAHCVDLMLEEIGGIPKVKRACRRGVTIVGFIYNHTMTLNLMRKFTKKVELVRSGITRFATHFLTLQRLYNQRNNIRSMFASAEWSALSVSKDAKGKTTRDIVFMQTFWNDVLYTLKAMGPLVQVLRLVDNERKPAMGYIYEAMDRAKEAMIKSFNGNEDKYKAIFEIIDRRWDVQLHHPLHAAGHFLNPQYFYADPSIDNNGEINEGLLEVIEKLSVDEEDEDKATAELAVYRRSEGLFNLKAAIRNRTTMAPGKL